MYHHVKNALILCIDHREFESQECECLLYPFTYVLKINFIYFSSKSLSHVYTHTHTHTAHTHLQIQTLRLSLQASADTGQRRNHFLIAIALLQPLLVVWLTWQLVMYSPPNISTPNVRRPIAS